MSQNVYVRTNKQASKQTNKQTHKHTNTQTYKHTYIQPASQPARQAGRQAGRQTDRQTDRHTYIHTYNNTSIHQYIIFHQQTHLVASSEGFSHCHGRCSSATAQLPESWSWSSMAQWMPGAWLLMHLYIYMECGENWNATLIRIASKCVAPLAFGRLMLVSAWSGRSHIPVVPEQIPLTDAQLCLDLMDALHF